jgi:hypothetical protein
MRIGPTCGVWYECGVQRPRWCQARTWVVLSSSTSQKTASSAARPQEQVDAVSPTAAHNAEQAQTAPPTGGAHRRRIAGHEYGHLSSTTCQRRQWMCQTRVVGSSRSTFIVRVAARASSSPPPAPPLVRDCGEFADVGSFCVPEVRLLEGLGPCCLVGGHFIAHRTSTNPNPNPAPALMGVCVFPLRE